MIKISDCIAKKNMLIMAFLISFFFFLYVFFSNTEELNICQGYDDVIYPLPVNVDDETVHSDIYLKIKEKNYKTGLFEDNTDDLYLNQLKLFAKNVVSNNVDWFVSQGFAGVTQKAKVNRMIKIYKKLYGFEDVIVDKAVCFDNDMSTFFWRNTKNGRRGYLDVVRDNKGYKVTLPESQEHADLLSVVGDIYDFKAKNITLSAGGGWEIIHAKEINYNEKKYPLVSFYIKPVFILDEVPSKEKEFYSNYLRMFNLREYESVSKMFLDKSKRRFVSWYKSQSKPQLDAYLDYLNERELKVYVEGGSVAYFLFYSEKYRVKEFVTIKQSKQFKFANHLSRDPFSRVFEKLLQDKYN